MGKVIRLTESDLTNIIKRVIIEQTGKKISIRGVQPANNTDWDLVHGILGSKRIEDDLEKRVSDELKRGNYRVTSVNIKSYKQGNNIVTDGEVTLQPVGVGQLPHKYFTTRGAINNDYLRRYEENVRGVEGRLMNLYKGNVETFGPYIIPIDGTNVKYKQSFFAIEGTDVNSEGNTSNVKPFSIDFKHGNPERLRTDLKTLSKTNNLYDPEVKIDIPNKIINIYSKKTGDKVSLSYIFSDRGELDSVLSNVSDPKKGNNVFKTQNLDIAGVKGYIIHMRI